MAGCNGVFGFLLRKTFYDFWDNFLKIVLVNVGFIALFAVLLFLPELFSSYVARTAIRILAAGGCLVYLCAAAMSLKSLSDYESFYFADVFRNLKQAAPAGLFMGLLLFAVSALALAAFSFYAGMDSMLGLVFAVLVFWFVAAALLSLQFFFAIRARLDAKPFKVLKKCILIFFDNPGMAFFVLLNGIAMLLFSVPLGFLLPGPAGVLLFVDQALRLRLLKYDWLEANPGADRRKIPWDALLAEEREKTGKRTLKNLIFPWRD
ncbi:MAG: hypothetical protein FWG66_06895 [Spirochaetes bacterium]|nr:hypothetical protein [Spirochaetota bacterium]